MSVCLRNAAAKAEDDFERAALMNAFPARSATSPFAQEAADAVVSGVAQRKITAAVAAHMT